MTRDPLSLARRDKVLRLGIAVAALLASYMVGTPGVLADASPTPGLASPAPTNPPPMIAVNPNSGPPGTSVTISGSGFQGSSVIIDIDGVPYAGGPVDSHGAFAIGVKITGFGVGSHVVCARPSAPPACAEFVLSAAQPTITVSPDSLPPQGGCIQIVGRGFPPGTIVAIYVDALTFPLPQARADGEGGFSVGACTSVSVGSHTICGDTGAANATQPQFQAKACAAFTGLPAEREPVSPVYPDPTPIPEKIYPTPSAALMTTSGFPVGPVAGGMALLLALGVGSLAWIRRRNQSKQLAHESTEGPSEGS